jgi:segregation and condensation protein B
VTGDERRETLADKAAAWVPPWERPRTEPEADDEASADLQPRVEAFDTEPEPVPEDGDASGSSRLVVAGATESHQDPDEPDAEPPAEADARADAAAEVDRATDSDAVAPATDDDEPVAGVSSMEAEQSVADAPPAAPEAEATAAEPDADAEADEPATPAEPDADAEAAAAEPAIEAEPAVEEQPALPLVADAEFKGALEAILLVVDEPVTEIVLAQILEQPTERIATTLVTIAEGYTAAGHGFDLRKVAGGWRLYTRPEFAAYVERFVLDGQSVRLTQAALETLAVVAYKQPVTRSRISAIRGVNCDGVIRTLVSRGLVEECGTEPESGAFLYRTTTLFLEKLGMNSVNDLPPLAPFLPDDVEEIADVTQ